MGDDAGLLAASYAGSFVQGLLDPDRETPPGVRGPDGKQAAKRYNVYRNNVTVSLIDALADIFPAVRHAVGEQFFRDMARIYVRSQPPRSRLLFEYGQTFASFIDSFEHTAPLPWLGDLARLERAWLDSYHATDAAPMPPAALAQIDPSSLPVMRFAPHPAMNIVRSKFPLLALFQEHRYPASEGATSVSGTGDVLVTRPHLGVVLHALAPGGAALIAGLGRGDTLADAAASAERASPGCDVGSSLGLALAAGAFSGSSVDGA